MRVIRECLAVADGYRDTATSHAIEEFQRSTPKRTVCFLISDFLHYDAGLGPTLAARGRKHDDLVGLRISCPAEAILPSGSAPLCWSTPRGNGEQVLANGTRAAAATNWPTGRSSGSHRRCVRQRRLPAGRHCHGGKRLHRDASCFELGGAVVLGCSCCCSGW